MVFGTTQARKFTTYNSSSLAFAGLLYRPLSTCNIYLALVLERFCGSSRYTRLSTNSYMFWAMPLSRNQSYKVTLICSSQPPLIMGVIRLLTLTPADIVLRIHIKKIYNTILKDSQRYSFINYYYFSCYFPP